MERRPQKVPFFRDDETEGSSIIVASLPYLFILGDDELVKDAVLNRVIGLNTHLDDTHIDLDSSFSALISKVLLNQSSIKH